MGGFLAGISTNDNLEGLWFAGDVVVLVRGVYRFVLYQIPARPSTPKRYSKHFSPPSGEPFARCARRRPGLNIGRTRQSNEVELGRLGGMGQGSIRKSNCGPEDIRK